MKKAFTMIELIFVIVILGVVASVATRMIAKTYTSYNNVNTLHKANIKVETAINNIAKRLSYAVPGTIVKRKHVSGAAARPIAPIDASPGDHEILEWVGSDVDGFVANDMSNIFPIPKVESAWSGYCDIDASTNNMIVTPGSDLNFESRIIHNLSNGAIAVINRLTNVGLFFKGNYNFSNIGYSNTAGGNGGVVRVREYNNGANTANPPFFNVNNMPPGTKITEHYKLAWSAYAVVPSDDSANPNNPCGNYLNTVAGACNATNPCNLCLVYNFRPWVGNNNDYYNANGREVSLLTSNVSVFKTYSTQNRVHIKICVKENYGVGNKTTSICKEKVVFR